jgi:diaminohydroxyphosphoribosylaminopyrimidine deaminase/5-amino-6-(5-phosphoribosylamino)uracil reductase
VDDETLMRRALALAERGRYSVSPNPMVGCVIARGSEVIAEGWHERAGEAHAEVAALRNCKDARGATMFVTLEPCAHHGRTPPCVDAVIAAGVARVVVAASDPLHGGAQRLRDAGIDVTTGVLEADARRQNEVFFHTIATKRPFVTLKAAMTLDGKLATVTRDSRWITSAESRERSLALREEADAILVGGGTVAADNPHLTRRLGWNKAVQPWLRVILDRDRAISTDTIVLNDSGATLHITEDVDLDALLADLHTTRGVQSIVVEGGSVIHSEFIRRGLWQKMIVFIAPMIVGGAAAPSIFAGDAIQRLTDAYRFRFDRVEVVGSDLMITAYPRGGREVAE